MQRTIDRNGFHTTNGSLFWNRPLYGPNRRCFVTTGDQPHAAFMWFHPQEKAYALCGHFLPGIISDTGAKWLYEADQTTATYDPGLMRFVIRDRMFAGEIQMAIVPLEKYDGYAVQIVPAGPIRLVFGFGGFLNVKDKDTYQGTLELHRPHGIMAAHYSGSEYRRLSSRVFVAAHHGIIDAKGVNLDLSLQAYLTASHETANSQHKAGDGISLPDLLLNQPGQSSVSLHQVSLQANESFQAAIVIASSVQPDIGNEVSSINPADLCRSSLDRAQSISHRVRISSPDTLIDLGARSLCVTMDALWEPPTFLHGPIGWGMHGLCGWRMAYGSDICGTYERTASHCRFFADNQYRGGLDKKPDADPEGLYTGQSKKSVIFSEGSIVNWGGYNMTEMWLDFVAHYYNWTGDREFLRSIWPAIRSAVEFQKRVFDMDGDGLYENYFNTYITDGHWNNGGGCTQASAYTYNGNLLAAASAQIAGNSPASYLKEAGKIRKAMNNILWMPDKGIFAEYKDYLGHKLLHPEPELGSIYHPVNFNQADDFQAYQLLRFTEWGLPNNLISETGPQPFDDFYGKNQAAYSFPQPMLAREVKSSNWRPFLVTNCETSPGELMDTARAYYKLGLNDRAFPLIKAVLRCMVNLPVPGGLVIRDRNTETWSRSWELGNVDHCDTLGSSLQAIVEGLFGIHPLMGDNRLEIQPGFPSDWDQAEIELRDFAVSFRRRENADTYIIKSSRPLNKRLRVVLKGDGASVTINGEKAAGCKWIAGICHPFVEVESERETETEFCVIHSLRALPSLEYSETAARGRIFTAVCRNGKIRKMYDPQGLFSNAEIAKTLFAARTAGGLGYHTAFLKIKGHSIAYWHPVDVNVREPLEIINTRLADDGRELSFVLQNNDSRKLNARCSLEIGGVKQTLDVDVPAYSQSSAYKVSLKKTAGLAPGLNPLRLLMAGKCVYETKVECWDLLRRDDSLRTRIAFEPLDISPVFNDDLALVHTHEYLSPRSPFCSFAVGSDLFRDGCHVNSQPCGKLDLEIMRQSAAKNNGMLVTPEGIPFRASVQGNNIVFVSQWDNFPKEVKVKIGRKARHVYFLMSSVTNPMQSGVVNGRVVVNLARGRKEILELINPANLSWCVDEYPGSWYGPLHMIKPNIRLGEHVFGTVYSMPLPSPSQIDSILLESVCNEAVIGLMAATIIPL